MYIHLTDLTYLCAGCRQVLHNAVDERSMQKLLRIEKQKEERMQAEKDEEIRAGKCRS